MLPMTAITFLPGFWLALALDILLGDPRSLPHPVILIGRLARVLESFFRKRCPDPGRAGLLTVAATLIITGLLVTMLFAGSGAISSTVLFFASVLVLYTTIALRGLLQHAMAVYHALPVDGEKENENKEEENRKLEEARRLVGRIVGRDTTRLDRQAIVRACVESVAENMSDGVVAPVFYAFAGAGVSVVFGMDRWSLPAAALSAMLYKAVNTMDSMFGYKNDKYLYFGRCAALLDDLINYIPARLSAFSLVAVSFFFRNSGTISAWRILLRDHANHSSPNAGWPEAAMAGTLSIQLGGASIYFGEIVEKPFLGDGAVRPTCHHIKQSLWVMVAASLLFCCGLSFVYSFVLFCFEPVFF